MLKKMHTAGTMGTPGQENPGGFTYTCKKEWINELKKGVIQAKLMHQVFFGSYEQQRNMLETAACMFPEHGCCLGTANPINKCDT